MSCVFTVPSSRRARPVLPSYDFVLRSSPVSLRCAYGRYEHPRKPDARSRFQSASLSTCPLFLSFSVRVDTLKRTLRPALPAAFVSQTPQRANGNYHWLFSFLFRFLHNSNREQRRQSPPTSAFPSPPCCVKRSERFFFFFPQFFLYKILLVQLSYSE